MQPDANTILFQLPTHYLPKIALRLEYLYDTIHQACQETHPIIHHYALINLLEMMQLIEKPELKSRFLKELMRIEHVLKKSSVRISAELHQQLHTQIQLLSQLVGLFGEGIHQNLFLQSIRLSKPSHQADCDMHSPQLLFWLALHPANRQHDLLAWLTSLRLLNSTVTLYLNLLRDTAVFNTIDMFNGFYQQPFPPKTTCHLILLIIDKSLGIIPQMQIGHHGLSLRLYDASNMREIRETHAKLDLAVCQL